MTEDKKKELEYIIQIAGLSDRPRLFNSILEWHQKELEEKEAEIKKCHKVIEDRGYAFQEAQNKTLVENIELKQQLQSATEERDNEIKRARMAEQNLKSANEKIEKLKSELYDHENGVVALRFGETLKLNRSLEALLDEAEKALQAEEDYSTFDCPHDAEQQCKCGLLDSELAKKCFDLRTRLLQKLKEKK